MSKKSTIKLVIAILAVGLAAWAIIPVFIDREVSESAPEQATVLTTAPAVEESSESEVTEEEQGETPTPQPEERVGRFQGRNNYDAEGSVKLVEDASGKRFVRFEDNFKSDNGPDLIVYIGTADNRGTSLGALKGNIGAQNYELPDDLDLSTVDTVRVFCRSFNADFAIATL